MASAVTELESNLQGMLGLKPPGVTGSRITSITKLCIANVQSESVLIQKIYTHFKKAPGTHKLGVLYVVDSVTRKWLDHAKANGQTINSSAQDGTFAAGVHRVTELMPVLMNDIIQAAPEDQKEKIKKLVDIWDKGQTFPAKMVESFKEKLSTPLKSTTPEGTPPPNVLAALESGPPALPASNSNAIMEALANIARQNASVPQSSAIPTAPPPVSLPAPATQNPSFNVAGVLAALQQPAAPPALSQSQPPPSLPYAAPAQSVNAPAMAFPYLSQPPAQTHAQAPPAPQPALMPAAPNGGPGVPQLATNGIMDAKTQQQVLLIKALIDQGVPPDQIPTVIHTMAATGIGPAAPQTLPGVLAQNPYAGNGQGWNAHSTNTPPSRDHDAFRDGPGSPRHRNRSRSRSPGRHWDSRDSPRAGRDRGNYGRNSPNRGRHDGGGRGRDDYRQRSPAGRRGRSPSPQRQDHQRGPADKWMDYDSHLPPGHIKVLSRTLFVGGVTCSEPELRNIFSRHGTVQTCIVNREKRHAFVKMISREDAVRAKEAMDEGRNQESGLRCRWGVGFGPRDCSDYSTGISVIPIDKLTEADRKWMLTAEYGGSGGRPIETGLVVEEPDIEIGAGVSSKAISRRMATDKGGSHGPKSTRSGGRHDDEKEDLTRWRRNRNQNSNNRDNHRGDRDDRNPNNQPVAPSFPYGIGTMPNGMPAFPPGFTFPAPNAGSK